MENNITVFFSIILLSNLISAILVITCGWKFGRWWSFIVTFIPTVGALVTTIYVSLLNFFFNFNIINFKIAEWIRSSYLVVNWGFLLDSLSLTMCFLILSISLLVQIYSYGYMFFDPSLIRFFSYLSFFTFFMLILVTADNLVVLFLGWEGVGLCSYLLISFWNTRVPALKSALKAMTVNRIGDFFLICALLMILNKFNSLDFLIILNLAYLNSKSYITINSIIFGYFKVNCLSFISFFLFMGAVGKSAQIGLHMWLPDAMEGPTPVSALIHAATMVTAGVFLIIRCSFLFELTPDVLNLMVIIGSLTAVFSGTCGIVETDIKKIIAYSTCSQLGYMILTCGLSGYNLSLFHLFNHAFFKALLFLSAGSVIHALSNEQNITKMGSLKNILKITFLGFFVGLLSLNAFPFTSGFYSKELIVLFNYVDITFFSFFLSLMTSFLTAFYSYRLLFFIFFSYNNIPKIYLLNFHKENVYLIFPIFSLILMSLLSGYLFKDLFIGLGSNFFNLSIFITPDNIKILNVEFLPFYIKILPLILSLFGWSTLNIFSFEWYLKIKFNSIFNLFKNEWYFNFFFNSWLLKIYKEFFFIFYVVIELGFSQLVVNFLSNILNEFSFTIRYYNTISLYEYTTFIFFNFFLFIWFFEYYY